MTASKIEWTDRSDWNPIRGCSRVSPGCGGPGDQGGCYAEAMAARFSKPGQWGHGFAEMRAGKPRWTGKVALAEDRLTLPLHWRRPAKVFVSSTSDVFHEALSDRDIDRIFAVMALCPHLTFQILTKRAERMRRYMTDVFTPGRQIEAVLAIHAYATKGAELRWPSLNVWLGVSVEDQERADERIPELIATPAMVRFLSAEPLLGPLDLSEPLAVDRIMLAGRPHWTVRTGDASRIDWMICGGESGPRARAMHPDWARSLRDQCAAAGVPFFFKQWGRFLPADWARTENGTEAHFQDGEQIVVFDDGWDIAFICAQDNKTGKPEKIFDCYWGTGHGTLAKVQNSKSDCRNLDGRAWSEFPLIETAAR